MSEQIHRERERERRPYARCARAIMHGLVNIDGKAGEI